MDDAAAVAEFMSVSPDSGPCVGGLIGVNVMGIPNTNKGKKKDTLLPPSPLVLFAPPNKIGGRGGEE